MPDHTDPVLKAAVELADLCVENLALLEAAGNDAEIPTDQIADRWNRIIRATHGYEHRKIMSRCSPATPSPEKTATKPRKHGKRRRRATQGT